VTPGAGRFDGDIGAKRDHLPDRVWGRRSLLLARIALGGNRNLHATSRPARADNLTPGTGRLAADNPTIVAQFCVQVRKIAIRITMTAITARALLVSVTNVRYVCS
jgi:hypothetical protein